MARVLTSDEIIESVKRRAMIPEDQVTFTKQDFLDILNEEMSISIVPKILEVHEEYYLVSQPETLVTNQTDYKIPYRATGNKLRDMQYSDLNGNVFEMTRVSIEDISDYQGNFTTNRFNTFYAKADQISLLTSVENLTGELQFSYFLRPNDLVQASEGAKITAIDTSTGVITLDNLPDNIATASQIDFIDSISPNHIVCFDVDLTAIDSELKTITIATTTFDEDIYPSQSTRIKVGDYVCVAGETVVPQIPTELIPLLAQRAAVHCLEALGDTEGLANATRKMMDMEKKLYSLIDNRVEGAPQKVVNRHGPLRSTLTRGFNRRQ